MIAAVAVLLLATACAELPQLPLPGVGAAAPEPAAGVVTGGGAPKVGNQAPNFSLKTPDGKLVTLADYRGKPVFLNFWATWCPPCRAEMPEIEAIHQQYRDRGLVVLGIDVQEDPETVAQFLKERSFTWTFVVDERGEAGALYRVTALPTSYFIDKDGVVRGINVGALTKSTMERQVAAILPPR